MDSGSVRVLVLRDNPATRQPELLMVKERPQPQKQKDDGELFDKPAGWGLPGGRRKLETNLPDGSWQEEESLYQAAFRELREETGIEADISHEPIDSLDIGTNGYKIYFFQGTEPIGEINPQDPDIECAAWIPMEEAAMGIIGRTPVYHRHLEFLQTKLRELKK